MGSAVNAINDDMFELTFTGPVSHDCPTIFEPLPILIKISGGTIRLDGQRAADLLEKAQGKLKIELR